MTKTTKPKTNKQIEKDVAKTILNTQISECIKMFESINPAMSTAYGNTTERKNAKFLITHYNMFSSVTPTRTVLSLMMDFIPEYNRTIKPDAKYGRILKPSDLVRHIVPFIAHKKKIDLERLYEKKQREQEENDKRYFEEQKRILDEMPPEEKERLRRERNERMREIIKGRDLTIKIK